MTFTKRKTFLLFQTDISGLLKFIIWNISVFISSKTSFVYFLSMRKMVWERLLKQKYFFLEHLTILSLFLLIFIIHENFYRYRWLWIYFWIIIKTFWNLIVIKLITFSIISYFNINSLILVYFIISNSLILVYFIISLNLFSIYIHLVLRCLNKPMIDFTTEFYRCG